MRRLLIFGLLISIGIRVHSQTTDFYERTDKYTIVASDTDSVGFPDYFVHQQQIDSISRNYSNWHNRALVIEKFMIRYCSVDIKIDSVSRIVKLQNGSEINLTPNDTADEGGYTYEKEIKGLNLLLFRVQWFEGNNYFLLNVKTGEKTYTIGRVFVNQDSTFLISINDDIEAGYSDNGFQLFEIGENGELKEIWSLFPFWAPEKIMWIDNSTLIVKGYYYYESGNWESKEIYKIIKINER